MTKWHFLIRESQCDECYIDRKVFFFLKSGQLLLVILRAIYHFRSLVNSWLYFKHAYSIRALTSPTEFSTTRTLTFYAFARQCSCDLIFGLHKKQESLVSFNLYFSRFLMKPGLTHSFPMRPFSRKGALGTNRFITSLGHRIWKSLW